MPHRFLKKVIPIRMKQALLLLALLLIGGVAVGQNNSLNVPFKSSFSEAKISQYLIDISQRSGIVLQYSSNSIDENKIVQLKGNESTIGSVLLTVLDGQYVKLSELNDKIIIIPASTPLSVNLSPRQFNFYGYVKEAATSEPLPYVTIYEPSTQKGVVANEQGYFNFKLPEGKHTIQISYCGYTPAQIVLRLNGDFRQDIALSLFVDTLKAVIVETSKYMPNGALSVSNKPMPHNSLLNDDDPLQFAYLSPGLQNASYSFNGFQVRGGGTDENQFLLNGNPIYNPTHMMGAVSILNPAVIKSMKLYRSDFPSRLEGALSSVLEVSTKQGNMKKWQGEINIGLLAGSLAIEGPLIKDKLAIMVSGRKNIPLPFYESFQAGVKTEFYDAHIRLSTIFSDNNKLTASLYHGQDQLQQTGKYTHNHLRWGNSSGALVWSKVFRNKVFIHTSVNTSRYQNLASNQFTVFKTDQDEQDAFEQEENEDIDPGDNDPDDDDPDDDDPDDDPDNPKQDSLDYSLYSQFINSYSSLDNYNVKSDVEFYISDFWKLNAGIKLEHTIIKPLEGEFSDVEENLSLGRIYVEPWKFQALSAYIEPEINVSKKIFLKPGLRIGLFQFGSYRPVNIQPRLYLSYRLNSHFKVFASYSRMNQFLHLVINPYAGANRDMWVPSTKNLKPEASNIYNIGWTYRINKNWRLTLDGYYKQLYNVTNYAEGKSLFVNKADWEQNIESGSGKSYGIEAMLNKTLGKFTFLANYALSWSWRNFHSINHGADFLYKYDHRHVVNVGIAFTLYERLEVAGLWSYASGNVYSQDGFLFRDSLHTDPTGDWLISANQLIYDYNKNNQYRAKSYQRYDFSLTYHSKKGKKVYSSLRIGVYNINGADNQYQFNIRGSLKSKSLLIRTGSVKFRIIPYLSYSLKF